MHTLLTNPLYILPLTLGLYLLASRLYARVHFPLFHPLLLTMGILIAAVHYSGTPYAQYKRGSELLSFFLGPSVVALGYLLHSQSSYLRGRLLSISASVLAGAVTGVLSVVGAAYLFGGNKVIALTLQPKSVTTPIGMALSEANGGIPELTAVIIVVAGLLGGVIGPPILKILGIKSPVARGLALGTSAHAMGTMAAVQMGAVEGAVGGLAIGLTGFFTALIVPLSSPLWP